MKNRLYVICACLITMIYFVLTPFSVFANTIERSSGGDVIIHVVSYFIVDAVEDTNLHTTYYNINDVPTSANTVGSSYKVIWHNAADIYCSDPTFSQQLSITMPYPNGNSGSHTVYASGMYSHYEASSTYSTFSDLSSITFNRLYTNYNLESPIVTEEVVALDEIQLTALMTRLNELFDNTEVSSTGVSQADELHNLRLWMINTYLPAIQQEYADVIANEVTIQNKIDTLNATIVQWLSTINSNITDFKNNIDNLIDTVSWIDYPASMNGVALGSNTDYISEYPDRINLSSYDRVIFKISSNIQRYNYLIWVTIPWYYYNSGMINISINDYDYNGFDFKQLYYYFSFNNQISVIFIGNSSINSSNIYLSITGKGFLYPKGSLSLKYLSNTDIEYWKLLDSITFQNLYDQYMNDYSDNSEELNNQSAAASSLITQEEQYHTSFNNSFQSDYNLIQNNFDFFNVTGDLLAAANWMSSFVNSMYINSGSFQVIMMIPLILGIIMWLIGRGSVLFREPYQRPEYVPDRTDRVYNKNTGEVTRTTFYTRK